MPTRTSRDRDNFHARVFKAISLSETRIKSTYIPGLPMIILNQPAMIGLAKPLWANHSQRLIFWFGEKISRLSLGWASSGLLICITIWRLVGKYMLFILNEKHHFLKALKKESKYVFCILCFFFSFEAKCSHFDLLKIEMSCKCNYCLLASLLGANLEK
jgi:hypothetical protein